MTIPGHILAKISDLYVILVFVLSSGAFLTLFSDSSDWSHFADGSPVIKAIWALIYLVAIRNLLKHRGKLYSLLRANKLLVLLATLPLFSVSWSLDPSSTLHQAATLILSAVVAVDLSMRYTLRRQLDLLRITLVGLIATSVLVELIMPGLIPSVDYDTAAWHGVFLTKNNFGKMTCLAVLVCLSKPRGLFRSRIAAMGAGLGVAVLSRSVSAVGYLLVFSSAFMAWDILKWKPKPRVVALSFVGAFLLALGIYSMQHLTRVTMMMGKDPHLTGRVDLWELSLKSIEQKPLLGYGYSAFWSRESRPARIIREEIHWDDAPHSHNGYIEMLLALGLVGLGVYLASYVDLVRRAYLFWMDGAEVYRKWALTYLIFVFAYQLTESGIFSGNTLGWLLYCCLAFSLPPRETRSIAMHRVAELEAVAA